MHHQAEDLMLQLNSVGLSRDKRDHQIVTDVTMLRNIAVRALCKPRTWQRPKGSQRYIDAPIYMQLCFYFGGICMNLLGTVSTPQSEWQSRRILRALRARTRVISSGGAVRRVSSCGGFSANGYGRNCEINGIGQAVSQRRPLR